jgi:4a-hydroxytetrahydrobiopterin dehydratase
MSWKEENNQLVREFEFSDFVAAFTFLNKVAELAEIHAHHPEIWNVYNKVRLSLTTHDAGNTITDKDHKLAKAIDALITND